MAIHLCLEGAAGPVTDKQSDLLHAGREDCERLQGVVDELIDLSRLSSARMEIRRAPLAAGELLKQAVKAHQSRAKEKGISLRPPPDEEAVPVAADPDRLPLVLSNLVANAVRYTPEGGSVDVSAPREGPRVIFEVAATGPGVPPGDRERIFEKFFRGQGKKGGAGLGLYIAREIVSAHGGEIGVKDRPGGGSVFWFALPAGA
jgi:signal transduction histidine kinase